MIFNFFKKKPVFVSGALPDTRSEEAKLKDFHIEEIATSLPQIVWQIKQPEEWKKYTIRNQDGSGSCVAQTVAKIFEIKNYREEGRLVPFSATPIYQKRINKPSAGMGGTDALDLAVKGNAVPEVLCPSQQMNDVQMDNIQLYPSDQQIGLIFKAKNYLQLPFDIDTIAAYIEQEGAVMLWFTFDYEEWTDVPKTVKNGRSVRHSITGVDFCLWNGEKAIVIDDSWGNFNQWKGQRVITETFLREHIIFAAVLYDLKNDWRDNEQLKPQKPIYTFTKELEFSTRNNDIIALQNILKYEGLFPTNAESTGYYGAITARCVLQFQLKYQVASPDELNSLAGRRVGSKTLAKLNELYGN